MSDLSLFIWVQHLFGKGHVRRMARIAEACAAQGIQVTVVAGGPGGRTEFRGLKNVSAHQLPALRTSDHQYTGLLTDTGKAPDEGFWQMRSEAIAEVMAVAKPDIVMVELFPFGRRKFAKEVLALIELARSLPTLPLVVSSVRDIVEPKEDPEKSRQMAGWLQNLFDAVLIHGDESIIGLEETAPYVADTAVPLHYTGYIAPEPPSPLPPREGVVISAGSGLSGGALLKAGAEAGQLAATENSPWHIFVPPKVNAPSSGANPHVHIHPFGKNFASFLATAEISISEAGYNTTAESLAYGAKPVLVAYEGAEQREQTLRATRFSEQGLVIRLTQESLDPSALIEAVEAAKTLKAPDALNLSGSSAVPKLLKRLREGGLAS